MRVVLQRRARSINAPIFLANQTPINFYLRWIHLITSRYFGMQVSHINIELRGSTTIQPQNSNLGSIETVLGNRPTASGALFENIAKREEMALKTQGFKELMYNKCKFSRTAKMEQSNTLYVDDLATFARIFQLQFFISHLSLILAAL